ncbi:MAG: 30S ribosome-binding factor RbfA [Actinomycetota bacterium]
MSPRSERAGFGKQPKAYSRRDRVGHQLQQVLADHLERTADENSDFITITGVDCSPDLRNATVFYTVYGDEKAEKHAAKELAARHGELRTVIAKSVRMKHTPDLRFEQDTSIERGNRIERLLHELRTGKREDEDDQ